MSASSSTTTFVTDESMKSRRRKLKSKYSLQRKKTSAFCQVLCKLPVSRQKIDENIREASFPLKMSLEDKRKVAYVMGPMGK